MEISSDLVGTPLKDYSCEVNWRDTMNYAAAIEDNNPCYFDDEREEGIVAHPMFAVATSWPIAENMQNFITADDFPFEVMMTLVHYTEHLKIHRLMKPGDELTIKSKIAAILPHRAGTHVIFCLNAVDRGGELVFTEFIGGMLRGVECTGGSKGEDQIPEIPVDRNVSSPLWTKNVTIDLLRSYIYDGCTRITFPIHTSKQFARQVGLPGIILQGTATLAYAVKEIIDNEAQRNPFNVREIACRFTNMVLPGTDIQIALQSRERIEKGYSLFFTVYNGDNEKSISNGYVLIEG
ncbi:MAG: MaoC/PaaZ C-terminal domain-containing protein [Candidatus Odinarchaeota archaeon]